MRFFRDLALQTQSIPSDDPDRAVRLLDQGFPHALARDGGCEASGGGVRRHVLSPTDHQPKQAQSQATDGPSSGLTFAAICGWLIVCMAIGIVRVYGVH